MNNVRNLYGDKIDYAENQYECLEGCGCTGHCTEWNEFRTPNFLKIVTALKNKVIFDGRNLFETNARSSVSIMKVLEEKLPLQVMVTITNNLLCIEIEY